MKPEACIRAAARAAKLDYVTLLHGRGRDAAAWRQVAIFIIRDSGCTTAHLAALFGRDVSTIRASLQKIRRVESKSWFTDLVAKIKAEATDPDFQRSELTRRTSELLAVGSTILHHWAFGYAD